MLLVLHTLPKEGIRKKTEYVTRSKLHKRKDPSGQQCFFHGFVNWGLFLTVSLTVTSLNFFLPDYRGEKKHLLEKIILEVQ